MKLRSLALSTLLALSCFDQTISSETDKTISRLRELGRLEKRIPRFGFTQIGRNKTAEKYALLAYTPESGASRDALPMLYGSLVEQGYSPKEIFILDKKGTEDINYVSDGKLNSRNLCGILTHFRGVSGEEDRLFLYFGIPIEKAGKRKTPSLMFSKDDSVPLERVLEKLRNTPAGRGKIVFDYNQNGFSPKLNDISFNGGDFSVITRERGSAEDMMDFFKIWRLKNHSYSSEATLPEGEKILEWYEKGFGKGKCPISVSPKNSLKGKGL